MGAAQSSNAAEAVANVSNFVNNSTTANSTAVNDVEKSMPKAEPKKVFKGKHEVGKKIVDNSKNMDAILKELKSKSNS